MNAQKLSLFFTFFFLALALVPAIAGFNWFVNPFNEFILVHSFKREHKTDTTPCMRRVKAADIRNQRPDIVFLGSSRVQIGFDMRQVQPLLGDSIYNAGFAAANMEEIAAYFEHALYHQPNLKMVIIGIDLFAFNLHQPCQRDFSRARLAERWDLSERMQSLVTWDTFKASLKVIRNVLGLRSEALLYVDDLGDVPEAITDLDHARQGLADFSLRDRRILIHRFGPHGMYDRFELSDKALRTFEEIAEKCRQRGIQLKAFICPCRMTYWYAVHLKGLAASLHKLRSHVAKCCELWDFSTATDITSCNSADQSYFDSDHFRPNVGYTVITEMCELVPSIYGQKVHDSHVMDIEQQWQFCVQKWELKNPQDAEMIHDIVKGL